MPRPRLPLGALRHRDFRLFLTGQLVSLTGTWMQNIAQAWLVLELTDSAFQVGLVTTLGTLPVLLFTLYGGVVADRVDKRRFLMVLQSLMLLDALLLGILTQAGVVTVEWVMVLAFVFGVLVAFEIPVRQAFLAEMVGKEDLMNAIALNSTVFNVTRVFGPMLAGLLIAAVSIALCFLLNAASYLALVLMLTRLRVPASPGSPPGDALDRFREGTRYVLGQRGPRTLTVLTATFSVFGFSFATMLPVYAQRALQAGAQAYGALMSSVGLGAAAGALTVAAVGRRLPRERVVFAAAGAFGVCLIAAAVWAHLASALVLLTAAGAAWAVSSILTNTLLQTEAPDDLRGRVMGFYSFMVVGMAPFGALQAGWVAERFGVRVSIGAGGAVCLLTALILAWRTEPGAWPSRASRR